jgi:hypothetical protein
MVSGVDNVEITIIGDENAHLLKGKKEIEILVKFTS